MAENPQKKGGVILRNWYKEPFGSITNKEDYPMAEIQITAKKKIGDEDKEAVIAFDFGDNLEDASAKFGADVVFTNFRGSAKITAQAAMRRYLDAGLSAEQVAEKMKAWKPGVALERAAVDPVAAIKAKWGTMSDAEKQALLSDLRKG